MLFCGVDIGTTNLKVCVVDRFGRSQWTRSVPTPRRAAAERLAADGRAIITSVEDLVIEGWRAIGGGKPFAAISTTGVGEDGLYVDEALEPLSWAIPWFDRSAAAEAAFIRESPEATTRSGVEMDHTRTGARWLWFRKHEPETVARARYWIALTDYPAVAWSSCPFISESLAGRTGCYDIERRDWLDGLLKVCGAAAMPPVLRASDVVGPVRGRRLLESGAAGPETVVVAGGHDHPVAASYIQRFDPTARVDSIGTANVVYGETRDMKLDHFDPFLAFMVPVRADAGTACLGVFEFSAAVQSLIDQGVDIRSFLALSRMPGAPNASGEVRTAAIGAAAPRAVFETASLTARRMMDRMSDVGVPKGAIFATGGWSRSRSLLELRASVFGQSINILSEQEPGVVGAALLAAEGIGEVVDLSGTISIETMEPDEDWAVIYDDLFRQQFNSTPDRAGA
ncbi:MULTISPECIES: L-fuculokinase [unclassified Sinorhizobium]|uniref:FGGY-family carbohydrate kinase n=1 Tax=unclassified Sinorhizobium TaxID=2613772 RepID=UPI003523AFAA